MCPTDRPDAEVLEGRDGSNLQRSGPLGEKEPDVNAGTKPKHWLEPNSIGPCTVPASHRSTSYDGLARGVSGLPSRSVGGVRPTDGELSVH